MSTAVVDCPWGIWDIFFCLVNKQSMARLFASRVIILYPWTQPSVSAVLSAADRGEGQFAPGPPRPNSAELLQARSSESGSSFMSQSSFSKGFVSLYCWFQVSLLLCFVLCYWHTFPHQNSLSNLSIPFISPQGTPWYIKGCPMVSFNTTLCPICPSHPSVPRRCMEHHGM